MLTSRVRVRVRRGGGGRRRFHHQRCGRRCRKRCRTRNRQGAIVVVVVVVVVVYVVFDRRRRRERQRRRGADDPEEPVVIDASGSDDKRVRMVSFFTMIMYPLFIYIYLDLTLIHSRCDLRQHSIPIHRPYLNFLPRHQCPHRHFDLGMRWGIFFEYSS